MQGNCKIFDFVRLETGYFFIRLEIRLSEKLSALGIMGEQLRLPLKPLNADSTVMYEGFRGPSIGIVSLIIFMQLHRCCGTYFM